MRILVTNDDGFNSTGITALAEAMSALGEVIVVAPDGNRSAAAHSLTLDRPLRLKKVRPNWYACDGTPSDCVHLALNGLLRDERPALVASGINHGANMAQDITYSGTVMAALEAMMIGVPSFAISLDAFHDFEFSGALHFAPKVARVVLENHLPPDTLLNVNVPNLPADQIKGVRATRLGNRLYGDEIEEKVDPRGKNYYWIAGLERGFVDIEGSDMVAVRDGFISVTPIHFKLTNCDYLEHLKKVQW